MLNKAGSAPVIKVLAVDDREENLMALQLVLQECEYEIICARSGNHAIELIQQHEFAAILLDIQMPGMDGFQAAQKIRRLTASNPVPILFLTAFTGNEEYEKLGYIAGAVDYLFKPFNIDILKAKLEVFAELYRKNKINQIQAELLKDSALKEQENMLLKEAVELRDEFLSMASHELKTPITPLNLQMQAFIRMFEDGSIEKAPKEILLRMLRTSQNQVDRLSKLIGELVDVSSMKAGKLELRKEPMNLSAVSKALALSFQEEALAAGCELVLNIKPNVVGNWDKFRIEQVIINLITNAIKYGAGAPIEISVNEKMGNAFFTIKDYGIGIAKEDQIRIFERFERAVSSKNYGGLGLGLYIAYKILRLHDGDIMVDSKLGEGAKFTFDLPM